MGYLPDFHEISVTEFRKNISFWMRRVSHDAEHIFLHKHGRCVGCVVTFADMQMIERLRGIDLHEHRKTLDQQWEDIRRAKRAEVERLRQNAEAMGYLGP